MEHIARYEILDEIGRGGFGRVYRANDPLMKCEVAIKVISNANDPEMLARFRGEAAAARKLHHESIVTIYDVGEDHGVPYIVMEYLQGMDLQKIREVRKPLALVEQVRILSQVAAGLQVAHENGIIHRDVKPANIMLLNDGSVKIMDFGIARATRDAATHLTRTGVVVGTLQYIPPEQFEGHPPDALADIWAFGVIAFQLFSGKSPFEAAETMQVIYNITSLPIPDMRELNPELPAELCQLVHKLLLRDRSARYQSFEDVRIDLNPVLETLEAQEAGHLVDGARVLAARGDLPQAHQIVRQVLERHPSHAAAKQLRDQIVTQMRAGQANRQVEELLKKGDRDLSAGNYEGALGSYGQACKLNPDSATARMRWERAQKMAERAARMRESLNQARSRLAARVAKEAEEILAVILAEDPDNPEAASLMQKVRQERAKQDEAARASAILFARQLVAQRQYVQARAVLDNCAAQVGDHADLLQAREEANRAESAGVARARVEAAIAAANQHLGNADYTAASAALTPLALEFPDDADIRGLLTFIVEEEARTRRMAQQSARAARPAPAPVRLPSVPAPVPMPDRAVVIERALEMSRERERNGQVPEAIHVLEVALSRYTDARELENERQRLLTPIAIEWAPGAARVPPVPDPAPASPPAPPGRPTAEQPAPPAPSRRTLWVAIAGAGTVCAGLAYWQFTRTGPPVPPPKPAGTQAVTPSAPVSPTAPAVAPPLETKPDPLPAGESEKLALRLSSLLPPGVHFSYQKGGTLPQRVTLAVKQSRLQAVVRKSPSWVSVSSSNGNIVLDVKPSANALAPGEYHGIVQVTSDQDSALLDVSLAVSAEARPELVQRASPSAAGAVAANPSEVAKPLPSVLAPGPPKPYFGPKRGRTNWTGTLPAGARLVLGESGVLEGGGILNGNDIPPTDVAVSVTPRGLDIRSQPPPNPQRVVIVNSSGAAVEQIVINWNIK